MRKQTTSFALLGLLCHQPGSGYSLKKRFEGSLGFFWQESFGQIYLRLKQMTNDGWIEPLDDDSTGLRTRQFYRITPEGQQAFQDWLQEPPTRHPPRDELLLKLFFCRQLSPKTGLTHLKMHQHDIETRLKVLSELETSLTQRYPEHPDLPYWQITISAGVHGLRARLAWCRETRRTLIKLSRK